MESKYNKILNIPTRILHIIAHPDDETIYGGGLLALNQALGGHSHVVCLGGASSDDKRRIQEFQKSCEILDVTGDLLGLDAEKFNSKECLNQLASLIRLHKPNFLLTHSPYDFHSDHHATRKIAKQAAMNESSRTAGCQVDAIVYTEGYTPHLLPEVHSLIDIGCVSDKVLSALKVHNSQEGVSHYEKALKVRWALRGIHAGCEKAEAFFIDPLPVSTRLRVKDYTSLINKQDS